MTRSIAGLLILIIGVSPLVSGQLSSPSEPFFEYGKFPCDGFRGNIDILLAEVERNPGSDGLVVNVGAGEDELLAVMREEMMRNHISFRGFDASRVRFARTTDGEFLTRNYLVPAEANAAISKRNYKLTSVNSPVVIEDHEFDDLCPGINYLHLFGELLEQNPAARATITVWGETQKAARKREKIITAYLAGDRKLSSTRFKTFLKVKGDFQYGMDPYVEYTYIP